MVKPFQFSRLPLIHFRNGVITELPKFIQRYGKRIILVTGNSSFINTRQAERLFQDLEVSGISYSILSVKDEPSPELIDKAIKMFNNEEFNLVVGIGGGSVLDTGKAISAMMYRSESVFEFLEVVGNKEHPGTKIPYIAIPTTSGTGSEVTKNAVISRIERNGFKRSLRHDNFVPDIALIDPELTLKCPKDITAASGMDCFTQLTEAYLSVKSNEYTDALAFEGLKAIRSFLLRSYSDGEDTEARTGMSFAALTSGICLANAGLGAVHGFASSIGGMYHLPHGLICGTLMPKSNEINIRELRKTGDNPAALKKYAILGELFVGKSKKTSAYFIDGFADYLYKVSYELKLSGPGKLVFDEKDLDLICSKTEIKNNPVRLTRANLYEIAASVIQ